MKQINKIIKGDCIEVMKSMEENSVDTIITDPPYGIGFMGKEWDNFKPSAVKNKKVVADARGLKRTDGRTSSRGMARDTGSYDQSLQGHLKFQEWCVEWMTEALRVAKPGATFLCCGSPRVYHHMALAAERSGWILKDTIMWLYGSGFPKATDISKQLDKKTGTYVKGEVLPSSRKVKGNMDFHMKEKTANNPQSEKAKLWNGWKSHGLKPAYEPILVAMKPNDGTYANNALKHGVSGLNIDGSRIPTDEEIMNHGRGSESAKSKGKYGDSSAQETHQTEGQKQGRFPANIILDEEAGKMLDEQSGESKSAVFKSATTKGKRENTYNQDIFDYSGRGYQDRGGASRFFYCAKASKAERNAGCENIKPQNASHDGRDKHIENAYQRHDNIQSNNHPTVKPLALMKYLCTLTQTPTGGIVLDPFCGSGTTLIAAKEIGRPYIGIEREKEYVEIAEARLKTIRQQKLL